MLPQAFDCWHAVHVGIGAAAVLLLLPGKILISWVIMMRVITQVVVCMLHITT